MQLSTMNKDIFIIKFKKVREITNYDLLTKNYSEIADSEISDALLQLREKYDFEIISMKIRGVYLNSSISIRCKNENISNILLEFSILLEDKIKNIRFK